MEQVLRKLPWKDALLDLLLVNRVDLVSEVVVIGSHLGHSNHKAIEFKISSDRRKSACKTSALDTRRTDLRLLRKLVWFPGKTFLQVLGSISAGRFLNITS